MNPRPTLLAFCYAILVTLLFSCGSSVRTGYPSSQTRTVIVKEQPQVVVVKEQPDVVVVKEKVDPPAPVGPAKEIIAPPAPPVDPLKEKAEKDRLAKEEKEK